MLCCWNDSIMLDATSKESFLRSCFPPFLSLLPWQWLCPFLNHLTNPLWNCLRQCSRGQTTFHLETRRKESTSWLRDWTKHWPCPLGWGQRVVSDMRGRSTLRWTRTWRIDPPRRNLRRCSANPAHLPSMSCPTITWSLQICGCRIFSPTVPTWLTLWLTRTLGEGAGAPATEPLMCATEEPRARTRKVWSP